MTYTKSTMTQLEWLRESIARLEPEYGPDNPFVKGLKTQIAGLESQQHRVQEREQFNLAVASSHNLAEEPEEQAAARLYEQRIMELQRATVSSESNVSEDAVKPLNRTD